MKIIKRIWIVELSDGWHYTVSEEESRVRIKSSDQMLYDSKFPLEKSEYTDKIKTEVSQLLKEQLTINH